MTAKPAIPKPNASLSLSLYDYLRASGKVKNMELGFTAHVSVELIPLLTTWRHLPVDGGSSRETAPDPLADVEAGL